MRQIPIAVVSQLITALLSPLWFAGTAFGATATLTPERWSITNARIVDGSGDPAYLGEVWIRGDRIERVMSLSAARRSADQRPAGLRIDAQRKVLAPGFVDPHAHGDPLETPDFTNALAMGVTTLTLGMDGRSPDVADIAAYQQRVGESGIRPNIAWFVGHGTLRMQAGVFLDPDPSDAQLAELARRLNAALDLTFGLSTGLEYNPGLHAPERELIALAKVVGRRDRLIASHLRSEDDDRLEDAIGELVRQGEHARVHVSHLKSVYGQGSERAAELLATLQAARERGIEISADVYPYSASYTGLALLFPVWAKTAEAFASARLERREALLDHLRTRVNSRNGPGATLLGTGGYRGKTLKDLENEFKKPFEAILVEDLGPGAGSAAYFVMDQALQYHLLSGPEVSVSSDGSPTSYHPRGHGTYARVIEQLVLEDGRLPLETAIKKMTSLPARQLGIKNRGCLAAGCYADLVLFDPGAVTETASYLEPLSPAEGFNAVWVNGTLSYGGDTPSTVRAGRVLIPAD
ncbi:MAG: amidohydrolase family protein [Pseudomonadota bacterium]